MAHHASSFVSRLFVASPFKQTRFLSFWALEAVRHGTFAPKPKALHSTGVEKTDTVLEVVSNGYSGVLIEIYVVYRPVRCFTLPPLLARHVFGCSVSRVFSASTRLLSLDQAVLERER